MQLMSDSTEPAMIFHVLVLDEGAAQAGGMFPGAGGGGAPLIPLDPLAPPAPSALLGPAAPPLTGLGTAQQIRRVCTRPTSCPARRFVKN